LARESRRTAGVVIPSAIFFITLICLHVWRAFGVDRGPAAGSVRPVEMTIIALYGVLTLIALARRPRDPRVQVFAALAVLVSLSVTVPRPDAAALPSALFVPVLLLHTLVFFGQFGVIVHMAALIPSRHRAVERYPVLLRANYLLAGLLVAAVFLLRLNGAVPILPLRWTLTGNALVLANRLCYLWGGVTALALLGTATRGQSTQLGRRQVVIVFFGTLLWTAIQVCAVVSPALDRGVAWFRVAELLVVLLVPTCFFVAILGFRLFDIGWFARRGLIYGLTLAVPLGALGALWIAVGEAARRFIGAAPTVINIGAVLLVVGIVLRPIARKVTRAVDLFFFPEKEALRQLQRSLIPEMAEFTDMDQAARHLVARLRDALSLEAAAILVGDEDQRFYRVRAVAGIFAAGEAVKTMVVDRAAIERWSGGVLTRPVWGVTDPLRHARGAAALDDTLTQLEAAYVVPIWFKDRVIGLLTLGMGVGGAGFDAEDLERIELIAHQVSAMLENARLFELATKDPLTDLPRRQVFVEHFVREQGRVARTGLPIAVGMVDIDDFKRVNDTFGHLIGDRVLRAVAGRLAGACRKTDLVARFGGDEFAVLLPDTSLAGAGAIGEALRRAVGGSPVAVVGTDGLALTVSVGMRVVMGRDASATVDEILHGADACLYRAKRAGKDRVETS
jgi:diguanylate cyclase (GGDEF)-like protein